MAKKTTEPVGRMSVVVNWESFTDGDWWELIQGEDFRQEPRSATRAARQWASKNGFHCSAYQLKNGLGRAYGIKVLFNKVRV